MPESGYFLTQQDFHELETIAARLAHFAALIFDQAVDQPQQSEPEF